MEKIIDNKYMIGTVLILISLFFIGGFLTDNMDINKSINDTTSINM